uniref:Uncharacterized protein n=1 Tax=Rhizophora mucronata TaxID=61149 RepID=A0A2P2Q1Z8_RHIMU
MVNKYVAVSKCFPESSVLLCVHFCMGGNFQQ